MIFVGLILALLIITPLMPRIYNAENTLLIKNPVKVVMNRMGNLNNYALWNPWQQPDPSAKKTITETPNARVINMPERVKKQGREALH
jgi:hypothetical protein